ncbi:MAG: alpha-1,4-glucan--maltose-1-phosphate maltosyltransferase, partial [Candidatus Nanopelagicales bacterium]
YQLRPRDWAGAARAGKTLAPYVTILNMLRRQHPALQTLRDITFHPVNNDKVIAYSRRDGNDIVIVVCTLDPYGTQEATVNFDMEALGMDWSTEFTAHDHIGNSTWRWSPHTYVRIDPYQACAHIVSIRKGTE